MATQLRDGSTVEDHRLDRLPLFDEASRAFPIRTLLAEAAKPPRSYTFACNTYNDQGRQGACVGFGCGHELAAKPAPVAGVTAQFSREQIYWPAQRDDPWPGGAYPGADPVYEGTAVLNGVKVLQGMGAFDSYRWSFGIDDFILAAGYGTGILGLKWRSGMFSPDADGFIRPTGDVVGGHCLLCRGVSLKNKRFLIHNSWGTDWGMGGTCFVSFDDMATLLADEGEACWPVGRHLITVPA